ncbi:oxygenase MpaB family protein [Oceanibaculum indicum]|uniref:ER-bound oxygenase mpaB/mpaB'/Rubber oxygenase catalytic domain-containing protein n=2 Tax=Oceanibaculum indicum TaxID=526216 RepID=K2JTW7_9PROT|nr:oxygenase MpaB family protein [Oceanibaculum indicum]EKE78923.1 hypothetical protein P24_01190 [Oceanibaculum indicum P24]RKQ72386.1 uncharacterized protein DUF2236 [Oceanibaculum indicum]
MDMPHDYREGHAAAVLKNPVLADRYVAHTMLGDPLADAAVAELSRHAPQLAQEWVRLGMDEGAARLAEAPPVVRDFFIESEKVPDWFDEAATLPGCRAFYRNSEMFVGAFVAAVLIEGFSTLISRSFSITGRMVDQGVRRLKQNNRQLVEIFLPGGLDRYGEGWKLSVRIRLVHARIRQLLAQSDEWESAAWGTPLSSAHIAFATAAFSGLLLKRARMLGVELSAEERDAFMTIWRYAGHLMGVDPALQCATEEEALTLYEIGAMCEPPISLDSILLANGLINSAPLVAGIEEPAARRRLARRIYRVSRAMIGDEMADALRYPALNTTGTLLLFRLKGRAERLMHRYFPKLAQHRQLSQFQTMLNVSHYADQGIGYRLPGHVHAEKDGTI